MRLPVFTRRATSFTICCPTRTCPPSTSRFACDQLKLNCIFRTATSVCPPPFRSTTNWIGGTSIPGVELLFGLFERLILGHGDVEEQLALVRHLRRHRHLDPALILVVRVRRLLVHRRAGGAKP